MVFTNTDVDDIHASYAKQLTEQDERISELEAENRRMREALEDIAVYGCGMLSQPATLNEPVETWLRRRIREYERRARAALSEEDTKDAVEREYDR